MLKIAVVAALIVVISCQTLNQQQSTCIAQALVDQIQDVIADCAGVDFSADVSCFFFLQTS